MSETVAIASERAGASFAAVRSSRLYSRERRVFGQRRWWPPGRQYEDLWPFADAWSALCTYASLQKGDEARALLRELCLGVRAYSKDPIILDGTEQLGFESVVSPPLGKGGDRFFDDNTWLGLALLRNFELTGDPALLALSERVFSFVLSGWSTDPTWFEPGGIRWKEPATNHSRNTCVNGPAAEFAARLHEKTGDATYADWAARLYQWTRKVLCTTDGLYVDQVAPDGTVTPTIWSYNQGSMIGAGVLLARVTGESTHLDEAAETAATFVDRYGVPELVEQDPAFNAIFFRNVLVLDQERPDARYLALAGDYAQTMWTSRRLGNGLFDGRGSPLNNTAAMLQIYALLAGAEAHV